MVLASRLQRAVFRAGLSSLSASSPSVRPVLSLGRRAFASASSGPSDVPVATPGFTGTATATAARPIVTEDDSMYAWFQLLQINQRKYNAEHYPSTPLPASYALLTKIASFLISIVWALAFVAMGAAMSTGVWIPYVINYQRRAAEKRFAPLKGEIN